MGQPVVALRDRRQGHRQAQELLLRARRLELCAAPAGNSGGRPARTPLCRRGQPNPDDVGIGGGIGCRPRGIRRPRAPSTSRCRTSGASARSGREAGRHRACMGPDSPVEGLTIGLLHRPRRPPCRPDAGAQLAVPSKRWSGGWRRISTSTRAARRVSMQHQSATGTRPPTNALGLLGLFAVAGAGRLASAGSLDLGRQLLELLRERGAEALHRRAARRRRRGRARLASSSSETLLDRRLRRLDRLDLQRAVVLEPGRRRDQLADDHVLLQARAGGRACPPGRRR